MKTIASGLLAAVLALAIAGPAAAATHKPAGFNADAGTVVVERRKKRVKGGSGCDDPGDVAEHPECR